MQILAIESSCDETGAAILRKNPDGKIELLANSLASSASIHETYGGVVPEVAAREQLKVIVPVIEDALKKAGVKPSELDAIAVAVGPGLIGSLLVGIETAKTLALVWKKKIIPVNHLVGHVYANWLDKEVEDTPIFPALALVVSGGHTDLVSLQSLDQWLWLAGTRDDAAGECFDKCSRILGFGYPGGPALEQAALKATRTDLKLPRPLINETTLDFSFSGLKSALIHANNETTDRNGLAQEVIESVADCLVAKTRLALIHYPAKSLILAGGVAANKLLRDRMTNLAQEFTVPLFTPEIKYCTDNPAMIGAAALMRPKTINPLEVKPIPGLEVVSE